MEKQHIVRLDIEQVKRITAFRAELDPARGTVILSGANAQGKSSVLDAILMAVTGKTPPAPVRQGADRGQVIVETEELRITKKLSAAGTAQLEVASRDGEKRYRSPQAVLDNLLSSIGFDPLSFTRMKPKDQRDALLKLAGIETEIAALEADRAAAYIERTDHNREAKRLEAVVKSYADLPAERVAPVSNAELMAERKRLEAQETAKTRARTEAEQARERVGRLQTTIQEHDGQIAMLRQQLKDTKAAKARHTASLTEAEQQARVAEEKHGNLPDIDFTAIDERISSADEVNRIARRFEEHHTNRRAMIAAQAKAQTCADKIEKIDQRKLKLVSASNLPVTNMDFTPDGVTLNGVPLEQASTAEQIRLGLALAAAANPKLAVCFIRDGEKLDADSLAAVKTLASEHDLQIWIETVKSDDAEAIQIVDGANLAIKKNANENEQPN